MGSKAQPGRFDCYAAAETDEPMFILLGRDRHAAGLVRLWALLREREGEDPAKVAEALDCADQLDAYASAHGKGTAADRIAAFEPLITTGAFFAAAGAPRPASSAADAPAVEAAPLPRDVDHYA